MREGQGEILIECKDIASVSRDEKPRAETTPRVNVFVASRSFAIAYLVAFLSSPSSSLPSFSGVYTINYTLTIYTPYYDELYSRGAARFEKSLRIATAST